MTNETLQRLIRPEIQVMQAYHVQPSQGLVKLDIMENPYDLTAQLKTAWLEKLRHVSVNRYPDAEARILKERLVQQNDLPQDCDVIFGNGSDELIQMIIQSLRLESGPVMSVAPTFAMFRLLAEVAGKQYIDVSLNGDFSLNTLAMLEVIEANQPSCIFLAYPNNPTGNLFSYSEITQILNKANGLVVIDEAYLPFAGVTLINELANYPNVLVMRTFSKAGLAGLRFGMLFGHKHWLDEFNKIRLPFNINGLTQASLEFSLDNIDFFEANAEKILDQRERVYHQLCGIKGLDVFASDANFILFRSTKMPATQVFERLLERHILIKCLHKPDTMLAECLRVTIGTEHENTLFLNSMKNIL